MDVTHRKWKCLGVAICALAGFLGFSTVASAAGDLSFEMELLRQDMTSLNDRVDDKVRINGYYDFEYITDNAKSSYGHFRQHHMSIFLARDWDNWRFFTEVEFEDGVALDGDGATASGVGEVKIEYAWVEHTFSDALALRGGWMLLPQYWNVNHYPNITLSTNKPLIVGKVFPSDIAAALAHGSIYAGNLGVTYNVYAGNGQAEKPAKNDDNENKAVGGRVSLNLDGLTSMFTRFDVGFSGYNERVRDVGGTELEDGFYVWGADLQINTNRVELLAEYASRTAGEDIEGMYAQASVRVAGEARLFFRHEFFDHFSGGVAKQHTRQTLGVNYRPLPNIALKLEVSSNTFEDSVTWEEHEQLATSIAIFY